jgi:hypothetical protein
VHPDVPDQLTRLLEGLETEPALVNGPVPDAPPRQLRRLGLELRNGHTVDQEIARSAREGGDKRVAGCRPSLIGRVHIFAFVPGASSSLSFL